MTPELMLKTGRIADRARSGEGAVAAFGHHVIEGVDVSHGAILYLDSVTVSFDGFKALNNLSIAVDDGELRCIIGPNGAGKTTMMDCITGKTRPDAGKIFFGQTIDLTQRSEAGIVSAVRTTSSRIQLPTQDDERCAASGSRTRTATSSSTQLGVDPT